jgi:hypothetical protein
MNRFYDSSRLLISCPVLAHAYIIWKRHLAMCEQRIIRITATRTSADAVWRTQTHPSTHFKLLVGVSGRVCSTANRVRKTALIPILRTLRSR